MYNHAAMIAYFNHTFVLSWKNAPLEEDTAGQRVLYSTSADGKAWSKAAVLFPNMSTAANPAADFAGPFAVINGRLYASVRAGVAYTCACLCARGTALRLACPPARTSQPRPSPLPAPRRRCPGADAQTPTPHTPPRRPPRR